MSLRLHCTTLARFVWNSQTQLAGRCKDLVYRCSCFQSKTEQVVERELRALCIQLSHGSCERNEYLLVLDYITIVNIIVQPSQGRDAPLNIINRCI